MSLGGQALGALGRLRERELMQDATTSESEREMTDLNEQLSWRGSNGLAENQRLWTWLQESGRQMTPVCLFKALNSMSKLVGSKADSTPGLPGGGWAADLKGAGVWQVQKLEL